MPPISPDLIHLLWLIPGLAFVQYLGSPRQRGTIARNRVLQLLSAQLEGHQFALFEGLSIPSGGGTRRSDLLAVSKFGIFVIHPLQRNGQITGGEFQARWKEQRIGRPKRFDNPVHENVLLIDALKSWLDLPASRFYSLVVFCGRHRFSTKMPGPVVADSDLLSVIRAKRKKLLSPEQANEVIRKLEERNQHLSQGLFRDWIAVTRLLLLVTLITAAGWIYRDHLITVKNGIIARMAPAPAAEIFSPSDGPIARKQWEESLNCAYSSDSGRCTCIDGRGNLAQVESPRCRELAERGSVLNQ